MPTIDDNIRSMAALIASIKKEHHLTENTVLRIIDMNFALAQSPVGPQPVPQPDDDEGEAPTNEFPTPEQIPMFEEEELTLVNGIDEDEVLATTDHKELN